jgi:SNF2 family DNA or RNA helicase
MLLEGLVMIRRLKSEVAHELPQKDREIKYLNPDPCYLPEIKRLKAEGDQIYRQMKDPRNDSAAQKKLQSDQQGNMVRQYSVCGLSKIKGVIEEIVLLLEEAKLVKPDRDRSTSAVPISTEVINLYEAPEIASPVSSRLEEDVLSEVKKSFVAEDEEWMRGSEDDEVSKRPPSRLKRKSAHRVLLDCNDEDDDDFLFEDHKLGEPNKSSKRKAGSNRIQSASSRITSSTTDDYDSAEDEGAQAWKDLLKGKGKSTHKSKAKVKGSQSKSEIGDGRAEKLSRRDEVEELGLIRGVQSKKIIVFAHHKEVMNALEDLLRDYGVSYIRVDGEVTQNKRDVSIKKFQV